MDGDIPTSYLAHGGNVRTVSALSIEEPIRGSGRSGRSSERGDLAAEFMAACEEPQETSRESVEGCADSSAGTEGPTPLTGAWRSQLFSLLVMSMVAVNFDSGGTAATLQFLDRGCPDTEDHKDGYPCLRESDQGILGALPYIGLCVGCPFAGRALQIANERKIVSITLALNALATLAFGCVIGRWQLLTSKFLIGLTHSPICVYVPVWVDGFAPEERKATWVGIVQGCGALGAMFGYAVTAFLAATGIYFQIAFRLQAAWILACAAILIAVPDSMVNLSSHRAGRTVSSTEMLSFLGEGGQGRSSLNRGMVSGSFNFADVAAAARLSGSERPLMNQLRALMTNGLFLACCIGLSCLFFVMTAVQFWSSKFFQQVFHRPEVEVATTFIVVATTAPVAGVLLGGVLVDRLTADEPRALAKMVLIWSIVAVSAGLGSASMPTDRDEWLKAGYMVEVVLIWLLLYFGAMMLPPVMRLMFHAIPEQEMKALANALNTLLSNVLGYALGCALPGQVSALLMSQGYTSARSLHISMQIVFLSGSFCGMICMVTALVLVRRRTNHA